MRARRVPVRLTHGQLMRAQGAKQQRLIRDLVANTPHDEIPALAERLREDGVALLLQQP